MGEWCAAGCASDTRCAAPHPSNTRRGGTGRGSGCPRDGTRRRRSQISLSSGKTHHRGGAATHLRDTPAAGGEPDGGRWYGLGGEGTRPRPASAAPPGNQFPRVLSPVRGGCGAGSRQGAPREATYMCVCRHVRCTHRSQVTGVTAGHTYKHTPSRSN